MALDPSIILQGQQPQNPLTTAGQYVGLSNSLQQNQLLKTENQRQQVALDTDQLTNAWTHLTKSGEAATTLLDRPGLLSMNDFDKGATGILSDNDYPSSLRGGLAKDIVGIKANIAQQIAQQNPQGDPKLTDQIMRQSLRGIATMSENGRAQLSAINGGLTSTDVGPGIVQQRYSPVSGQTTPVGYLPKGLTPQELSQPISITDPSTGQQSQTTVGDWLNKVYGGKPPFAGPGLASGVQAAPTTTPTTSGIGPQASAELQGQGAANSQQANNLQQYASGYRGRKATLLNLRSSLDNFTPGPAAHMTKTLGQLASQFGISPPQNAEGTAAQEEFNKLAYQIAQGQLQAGGGHGTDSQTQAALQASPSEFLTKLGNKNVSAVLLGNEDSNAALNLAWQRQREKNPSADFGKFVTEAGKHIDPLAFQWNYMSKAQQDGLEKQLKDNKQWDGFQHRLTVAKTLLGQLEAQ